NTGSNSVQVWRGNGTGGFTLGNTLSVGAGQSPVAVAVGDFNADARPDIAVADRDLNNVKVFLANTTGGFGTPSTLSPGNSPRSIMATDFNQDGKLDLLVG